MALSRRAALAGALALPSAALARRRPPRGAPVPPPGRGSSRTEALALADGRRTTLHLWLPAGEPDRLLAFSHGALLGPERYERVGLALAAAGHAVAAPAHDEQGDPRLVLEWRVADMLATLDRLETLAPGRPLVAGGHSYGALVAQILGGARSGWPVGGVVLPDRRVRRVVALSPPGPLVGFIEPAGWARVAVPHLTVTGTADVVPPVAPRWEDHLAAHRAMVIVPRWTWVGDGADHWFGNRMGRPERPEDPAQTALFEAAMAAVAAFIEEAPPPGQPTGATLETA